MVDRITINNNLPTTIVNKLAPTDDSVRLLREMEEAAWKQVLAVCGNSNNSLNITQVIRTANIGGSFTLYSMFSLNGEDYTVKTELPTSKIDMAEIIKVAYEAISSAIAEKLVYNLVVKQGFL